MVDPSELYQKEMDELMSEITKKQNHGLKKLKNNQKIPSRNVIVRKWSLFLSNNQINIIV